MNGVRVIRKYVHGDVGAHIVEELAAHAGAVVNENRHVPVTAGLFLANMDDVAELVVGVRDGKAIYLDDVADVYAPKFESLVREQLLEIGEDPDREGLQRTPLRVAKAMDFLTSGYATSLEEVVNNAVFDAEGAEEMVLVKDIEFYSMCEHHMLPFFGKAAVAYLPKGKIIGLSKVARIVDVFARRLQVQERLTNQIARTVMDPLKPEGVGVVVEAKHLCMMMRGVEKQNSVMMTSSVLGSFHDDPSTRMEFLNLIKGI